MKRWTRSLILAVIVPLTLVGLTGCDNLNNTTYRVLDRFRVGGYDQWPDDKPKPPKAQFLWVKAWGTENQQTPKPKDIYIDSKLWDTCWLGDKYTIRKIGRDTCERTPESEMPTELKPGYAEKKAEWDRRAKEFEDRMRNDPEFRKKIQEKYGRQ